jgi:hypothetical protein
MKKGDKGPQVKRVQNLLNRVLFLIDKNMFLPIDGIFGPVTEQAVKVMQSETGLKPDGIAGRNTLRELKKRGYIGPYGYKEFINYYIDGKLPTKSNIAKYIKICDLSEFRDELSHVLYPSQIRTIKFFELIEKSSGTYGFRCHEKCTAIFYNLFKLWQESNLLQYIKTFNGSWVFRRKKNKAGTLSTHSFGCAFDINAQWNRFGMKYPPGDNSFETEMIELGRVAESIGICWGGYYRPTDAMHYQIGSGY